MSARWEQQLKAGVSGGVATAVDFATMALLLEVLDVPLAWVAAVALVASTLGAFTNFTLNKLWAFCDRTQTSVYQVVAYALISAANAVLVAALVHAFVHFLYLPALLSKALAALLTFFVWTYPAQARFVFSARAPALIFPPEQARCLGAHRRNP